MLAQFGTAIAVEVSCDEPGSRLTVDWLGGSTSASPTVYLVDPENHEYLRPIATSLEGEVLPGIPRTGVLVFERIAALTGRLQLHFSGVSLAPGGRGKSTFGFEYTSETLPGDVRRLNELPACSRFLSDELDREVDKIRSEFLRQQSGCGATTILLVALAAALAGGASWFR